VTPTMKATVVNPSANTAMVAAEDAIEMPTKMPGMNRKTTMVYTTATV
jgi:hypothetical protein